MRTRVKICCIASLAEARTFLLTSEDTAAGIAGVPGGRADARERRRAVAEVRPFGLDLCSGVCVDGALDPGRLRAFLAEVRLR